MAFSVCWCLKDEVGVMIVNVVIMILLICSEIGINIRPIVVRLTLSHLGDSTNRVSRRGSDER